MRQCLCSDSPRFTRKPIPPLCLLAPPSLFPPLFLHFSSSLHFFFRPSLYTFLSFLSLLGGEDGRFSPEEASSVYRNESSSRARSHPSPCFPYFCFRLHLSSFSFYLQFQPRTSALFAVSRPVPLQRPSLSRFFFPPFFLSSPLFRLHFASFVTTITRIFFSQLSPFWFPRLHFPPPSLFSPVRPYVIVLQFFSFGYTKFFLLEVLVTFLFLCSTPSVLFLSLSLRSSFAKGFLFLPQAQSSLS